MNAVTAKGVHAICYLGDHRWIHASPDVGKVIEVEARNTEDRWFDVPVKIMRWRILADTPATRQSLYESSILSNIPAVFQIKSLFPAPLQ